MRLSRFAVVFARPLIAALLVATLLGGCSSDTVSRKRTTLGSSDAGEGEHDERAQAAMARGVAQATAPAGAVALTEAMAEPYFASGPAAEAHAQFRLERWSAARDGFSSYLTAAGSQLSGDQRARIELLIGLCDAALGNWQAAAKGLAHAAEELPLIADYIHFQAARAYFFAGQTDLAMTHAQKVSADSISGADAELLIGDLLRGRGDAAAVAAHYRTYLEARPRGIRRGEARFRLAQALEELGQLREAADSYRLLPIAAPLSSWAQEAAARIDALLPKLDAQARSALTTLTAAERLERAMSFYENQRNSTSEAEFAKALAAPGLTAEQRCVASYHRANSVYKDRDRRTAAPLFDAAIAACKAVGNRDLHVKAAYQAGRSYSYFGERDKAIARYAEAETIDASHTFNDDARLRQAEEYEALGDAAKVTELLASIPASYPEGDMRAEAMWRLGWRAYLAKDYGEAIRWFRRQIEVVPIDDNWWSEGQPQYWMGRALAQQGKPAAAKEAYEAAVRLYPLSYYALLALNRLRESHAAAFKTLMLELAAAPAEYDPSAPSFVFQPRTLYAEPGFARALEFMRLGLQWPAQTELMRLGLSAPSDRSPVTDPDQAEKLWAMAFLYNRAGDYSTSHWPTRWHILDYRRHWPVGAMRARWEIAYPPAFRELLTEHAEKNDFPPELLMAIVREESAFDPILESYANAIGLTQMIFPTARRFADGTGIAVSRETLRDPIKNVTIGARFLGFLWQLWKPMYALIPPSYNAGEGATKRWLRARGDYATDEWIEAIGVDQPRLYSKRVLGTFFTYWYLRRGTVPEMPNEIPPELLRKAGASAG